MTLKALHVDEAANRLKEIVTAALNGDDVFLYADDPQRAVRLSPGDLGSLIWMADDFDAPLSEFKPFRYPNTIIRPYADKDHDKVIDLLVELQEYERTLDANMMPSENSLAARYLEGLFQRCQSNQGEVYVADVDKQVVGLVSVYREQIDENYTKANDYLYVADLIVTESYRGQGIATALLGHVQTHAYEIGTHFIKLETLANNPAAIATYRKAGFHFDGVTLLKSLSPNL